MCRSDECRAESAAVAIYSEPTEENDRMREGVLYELDCLTRACANTRAHRNITHSLRANARLVLICAFLVLSPERVECEGRCCHARYLYIAFSMHAAAHLSA